MTWETVLLGELVQSVDRSGPPKDSTSFTYVDLSSVDAVTKTITAPSDVRVADAPSRARQNLRFADVLVSTVRPNLNGVAAVPEALDGAVGSTGFSVLRSKPDRLEPRYLFHWTQSGRFVSSMTRLATGASYPAVSDAIVKRSRIPLPPLAEQRRIAAILDEADQLRTRATDRLRRMDEGARAAVAEIVGDAPTSRPLGSLIGEPLRNGISPSKSGSIVADVLTLSAITRGDFDARARKTDTFASLHAPDKVVRKGLHLICRGNGNPELVGTMAVVTSDLDGVAFPDTMIAMRPSSEISSSALDAAWRSRFVRDQIGRGARTTNGTYKINQQLLAAIQVPVGSPAQQEQIGAIEELRARLSSDLASAIRSSDALFASLQHRAFRGEL